MAVFGQEYVLIIIQPRRPLSKRVVTAFAPQPLPTSLGLPALTAMSIVRLRLPSERSLPHHPVSSHLAHWKVSYLGHAALSPSANTALSLLIPFDGFSSKSFVNLLIPNSSVLISFGTLSLWYLPPVDSLQPVDSL